MSRNYIIYNTLTIFYVPHDYRILIFPKPRIDNFSNCHRDAVKPCCRVTKTPPDHGSIDHASKLHRPCFKAAATMTGESRYQNVTFAQRATPKKRVSSHNTVSIRSSELMIMHCREEMLACQETMIFITPLLPLAVPMPPKYRYCQYRHRIISATATQIPQYCAVRSREYLHTMAQDTMLQDSRQNG